MKNPIHVIAALPPGLEDEGARELLELGANEVRSFNRCVAFQVDLSSFYRVNLRARLPFRFLREISRFNCNGPESLYIGIQKACNWNLWLPPSKSFRVDVTGSSYGLTHSHFSALQVKNAIIDFQRDSCGQRSNINLKEPDLCIHLHLNRGEAVLSLDSSSGSLHRRGYKSAMGIAPLKENLAAGLIRITKWDISMPLVDPLCGSGTFLIEAAMVALDIAPGLHRKFLFENWLDFDQHLWNKEKTLATDLKINRKKLPLIIGCEQNLEIYHQVKSNILSASLEEVVQIQTSHFRDLKLPSKEGIIVCNPPYGKRIGDTDDLEILYEELGKFCKAKASGWQLWILNGNPSLSKFLRMKANRRFQVSNGGIDCRWIQYFIN
tara:strand:- start:1244 stop:2380 length:1137 start_codon:yes stop_codon:yes gene_type:complete